MPGRELLMRGLVALLIGSAAVPPVTARDVDIAVISGLRHEGLQGSQVDTHLRWLADVYGPRVTGTPALLDASDWVLERLSEWGATDARREYWKFGEGWEVKTSAIRMVSPQPMQIIGYPIGWTPGTAGEVVADVVHAPIESAGDFASWRGRLRGKIVLIQDARRVELPELPLVQRYSQAELQRLSESTPIPTQWLQGRSQVDRVGIEGEHALGLQGHLRSEAINLWQDELIAFLKTEGVVAVFERGADTNVRSAAGGELLEGKTQRIDGGTVFTATSLPGMNNRERLLPWLTIAVEQYNRLVRVLELGVPVKVALNVEVAWYPEQDRGNGFNTLADIPGGDRRGEVIMLGAHLDGAHTASAAVDNAAGAAIVLEAARLLLQAKVEPRRTIRVALWGGEENGILGSRAYVDEHCNRPARTRRAAHDCEVSVYFNIDSGSGHVRAVSIQHNLGAEPLLEQWIEPLRDLGVERVARRGTQAGLAGTYFTSGSDHVPFDLRGVPTVQLLQDRLDYFSRTAHSNFDYADRASREGMIQASVVLAILAYQAAMSDAPLPARLNVAPARSQ